MSFRPFTSESYAQDDRPEAWRDVLGASLFTSFLLSGLKHLLAWYLSHLTSYAAYGAVGGVLGLLTWIYVASLVVFYGAEFSRVYAERFGSLRSGSPSALNREYEHGVRLK